MLDLLKLLVNKLFYSVMCILKIHLSLNFRIRRPVLFRYPGFPIFSAGIKVHFHHSKY